jgi:aspartate/methionine/tyrosine aminotransferase
MTMLAQRLAHISPFRVVELLERARVLEAQGHHVVHLEVGEPDFATAAPIVEAAHRALDQGATRYTQALGIPALRERIAGYYDEMAGIRVDAQRVVVTAGASGGLLLLSALLLDPGNELLLTDPGYPCNEVFVRLVNAVPVTLPVRPADGFQITAAQVAAAWTAATRGLLVASPANPTGAMLPAAVLTALAALVRSRDGVLILDEIYQGLTFPGNDPAETGYPTGLAVVDDPFVLNSFSKYFGMTGWRLGWMVLPEWAVEPVARLAQNLFISPPSLSQHAALAAFSAPAMAVHEQRRLAYAERRDRLADGLERLGFAIPLRPNGAFYLYVDIAWTGLDSVTFCRRLLEEHRVAVTPGIDFGSQDAERYVRFAYTTGLDDIDIALERIGEALARWGVG